MGFITLYFLAFCSGCQTLSVKNELQNKSAKYHEKANLDNDLQSKSCNFEQLQEAIKKINERGGFLTFAEKRKREAFLKFDTLTVRLQKNNLEKDLDSIQNLYLPNVLSNTNKAGNNIDIYLSYDGVTQINYYFLPNGREKNSKIAHQILDFERAEVIKYLNLVTDDSYKSEAILHELEMEYQEKLAKKDLVKDVLIVADVEKDGRIFELTGNYICRDEMGDCWCIVSKINQLMIK